MEDQQIIECYFRRDETAITYTAEKYGAYCTRIAMNTLGIREDVEECINDTYHAAWNAIPPARPQSLRAFLGRITRNVAIRRFRANRARKRYNGMEVLLSELEECVPDRNTVESALDNKALGQQISRWLDTLEEADRMLFVRRYWYGDALKDLAPGWGMTPAKMAGRMHRLRSSLRQWLEGDEGL